MNPLDTICTKATGPACLTAAAARLETGMVLGDWRIDALIGVGGMGTVYAATHTVIGKRAAIKVVRAELCANRLTQERFLQEARVVNQIGHANIVDIFHIDMLDDGRPYLVMELLYGRTLGRRMAEGKISPVEAIDLLLQVCDGLVAAHARGVVHRDLKPDNIFLCDGATGNDVKLVDWGIAKLMDAMPRSSGLTTTGTLVGTPQYMSPEQARGKAVDGRTDIYSLGAIAYELFLEGPPFTADNVADLVTMQLRELPPAPNELWPDIPVELERLLLAMLAKRPEQRPSLSEVRTTLAGLREQLGSRRWSARLRVAPPLPSLAVLDRAPTWGMAVAVDDSVAPPPPAPPHRRRALARSLGALASFLLLASASVAAEELVRDRGALASATQRAAAPSSVVELVALPAPAPAPAPAEAVLDVRIEPRRATVVIDGEVIHTSDGRLRRTVAPGMLELEITASGRARYQRTIEVGPGTVLIDVRLRPRPRPIQHVPESRRAVLDLDPDGTIDPFE